MHAVVARSTFGSQHVQSTPWSDHFWKLRCRKSARCSGAKHISKSKGTKHQGFGPLLEVAMSKKCTPFWREAHFQVKMYKTPGVRTTFGSCDVEKVHAVVARSTFPSQNVQNRTTFGGSDVEKVQAVVARSTFPSQNVQSTLCSDHFRRLRCRKVHAVVARNTFPSQNVQNTRGLDHFWRFRCRFASLHYTTLHYTTLHSTTLHYITLHCTTFHYTSLDYTTLHYTTTTTTTTQLHCTTIHSTTLHYTKLHYTTLHSLRYTTLHYTTLHYATFHYTSLHYTTLHYTTTTTTTTTTQLHPTTLHYTKLHYTTLINPCNAYNINQDSGAWVLILEGFWVLKLVFEWCRIHIKTVLAQHYSLVVFTYAWFIQATPVQVGPGPPKSAQVNPNLQVLPGSPRFSQVFPGSPRFSQVLPGSPRFSQEISDFL